MSRSRSSQFAALLCLIALLGACASESSGSGATTSTVVRRGTVPSAVWSTRVCRGFDQWVTSLDQQSERAALLVRGAPPAVARTAITGLFAQGSRSTSEYRAVLRRAGAPAVEHGIDLRDALARRIERLERIMNASRRQATELPISDAPRFQLALADLVNSHEEAVIGASRSIARLDEQITDPGLRAALADDCAS